MAPIIATLGTAVTLIFLLWSLHEVCQASERKKFLARLGFTPDYWTLGADYGNGFAIDSKSRTLSLVGLMVQAVRFEDVLSCSLVEQDIMGAPAWGANIHKIELRLVINDLDSPTFAVQFYDPAATFTGGIRAGRIAAKEWAARLEAVIANREPVASDQWAKDGL